MDQVDKMHVEESECIKWRLEVDLCIRPERHGVLSTPEVYDQNREPDSNVKLLFYGLL